MAIERLGQGTLTTASQIPFYDPTNGRDARASVNDLATLLVAQGNGLMTQYAAPNATGFTVTITPAENGESVFLVLTPLAGYAAGTITLPAVASCIDGQELLVACTQSIAALAVAGNGATVNGAPTALSANGFFRLRYDGVAHAWYRVG